MVAGVMGARVDEEAAVARAIAVSILSPVRVIGADASAMEAAAAGVAAAEASSSNPSPKAPARRLFAMISRGAVARMAIAALCHIVRKPLVP